jgi:aminoglycoside phosphotransferase (APT) family kinase protein
MHRDEIDSDVPLVRSLIAAQFPQWADRPIERVASGGTENAIYRLGSDLVVRLPLRPGSREQVEKLHRWLPTLGPLLPLPVPVPVAKGEPRQMRPGPAAAVGAFDRAHGSAHYLETNTAMVGYARRLLAEVLAEAWRGSDDPP